MLLRLGGKWGSGAVLFVAVATGLFGFALASAPARLKAGENLDDRDVIQTALLSFFKQQPWYAADWKPAKRVVLRVRSKMPKREEYPKRLDRIIEDLKIELDAAKKYQDAVYYAKRDKQALDALIPFHGSAKGQQTYTFPREKSLFSYTWDRRILPTDKEWSHLRPFAVPKNKRDPEFAAINVFAQVDLPTYSPDGNVAIVSMSVPWSIHHADVTFVMLRGASGWKIVYGGGVFFV